jgi:hypothetical protein
MKNNLFEIAKGLYENTEDGTYWKLVDGVYLPTEFPGQDEDKEQIDLDDIDDEFGADFLSGKFADADKKVESGEIKVCNLDNEDCEACGS